MSENPIIEDIKITGIKNKSIVEELTEIIPAIEECQAKGLDVYGPIPGDSIFHKGFGEECSAVLSLYQDQGNIAKKE